MAGKDPSEAADRSGTVCLRPHHLLCTQGYSGKGYDRAFTENMTAVTDMLRNDPEARVRIVFSTDRLCSACPNKVREGVCRDDEKVLYFDEKVRTFFDIEEKEYPYRELIRRIDDAMTPEMMDEICSRCSWYAVSACKKNVQAKTWC